MTREEILHELKTIGFRAEPIDTVENGQMKHGIVFYGRNGETKTKYIDEELEIANANDRSVYDLISYLDTWLITDKAIPFRNLYDRKYTRAHMYVALQPTSERDIIKSTCDMEGIEKYLYVMLKEDDRTSASGVVRDEFLKWQGLSKEEAFRIAQENSDAESIAFKLNDPDSEIGRSIFQLSQREPGRLDFQKLPDIYVITNKRKHLGAASVLNHKLMSWIAGELGTDHLTIIPSSIHECLVADGKDMPVDEMSKIIKSVNHDIVLPSQRLSDKAYTMLIPRTEEIM